MARLYFLRGRSAASAAGQIDRTGRQGNKAAGRRGDGATGATQGGWAVGLAAGETREGGQK